MCHCNSIVGTIPGNKPLKKHKQCPYETITFLMLVLSIVAKLCKLISYWFQNFEQTIQLFLKPQWRPQKVNAAIQWFHLFKNVQCVSNMMETFNFKFLSYNLATNITVIQSFHNVIHLFRVFTMWFMKAVQFLTIRWNGLVIKEKMYKKFTLDHSTNQHPELLWPHSVCPPLIPRWFCEQLNKNRKYYNWLLFLLVRISQSCIYFVLRIHCLPPNAPKWHGAWWTFEDSMDDLRRIIFVYSLVGNVPDMY